MANGKTQLLQKKVIFELTKEARKTKEDLAGYLEDLELYSQPEFWEAIGETRTGQGKHFASAKELLKELDS